MTQALFDAHLHIIDPTFPLVANQGFLPDAFSVNDYLNRMAGYDLRGGVVVSGSFQAFDQGYLLAALSRLGHRYVGVTQLPASTTDEQLLELHQAGIRGVRFNLQRGGSENVGELAAFGQRIYELAGWHVELYADAAQLSSLIPTLCRLPSVVIDHLGLTAAGQGCLLSLVDAGVRVKATGFGRLDFPAEQALQAIYAANPDALMFGSDLPSTRAPRPFDDADVALVRQCLGEQGAAKVLCDNAMTFYLRE